MKFFCTLSVAIILMGIWNVPELSAAKAGRKSPEINSSETESSATKPSASKPTATKPSAAKPTATKPSAAKPTATKPSETKSPASKSLATKTSTKETLVAETSATKTSTKKNSATETSVSSQKVSAIASDEITPMNVLSGHKGSFFSGPNGTFLKIVDNDKVPEVIAYQKMQKDPHLLPIIPKYYGVVESDGTTYVMLEDVAQPFGDRSELDIKLGHRTFSELEAQDERLREDQYKKLNILAPDELTEEEHSRAAITKSRSMFLRDKITTSLTKGFRITAVHVKGSAKIKDFMNKTYEQVREAIASFLYGSKYITEEALKRIKQIRNGIAKSSYYKHREVTGSSIFLVRNDTSVGGWLLDFNKTIEVPEKITVDHLSPWKKGNYEDGVLFGIDNLIKLVSDIGSSSGGTSSSKSGNSSRL